MRNPVSAVSAWESLFRTQHAVMADISTDFDGADLSLPEYNVLLTLTRGNNSSARLRDVTRLMLISQPSVSRLVDRMASRGLVTKSNDPDDRRGAIVTATPHGLELFRVLSTQHGRTIRDRMARLSPDELAQLQHLTTKLRGQDGAT